MKSMSAAFHYFKQGAAALRRHYILNAAAPIIQTTAYAIVIK